MSEYERKLRAESSRVIREKFVRTALHDPDNGEALWVERVQPPAR